MIIVDSLLELSNKAILLKAHDDVLIIRKHIREWTTEVSNRDSFMSMFGGHVHVLEDFQDFAQITFQNDLSRTTNLMCDYGAFDQCEFLYKSSTVVIHMCTSNSGGPTFYIPGYLTEANPFVLLSVKESG
jgi:hypothetical protein